MLTDGGRTRWLVVEWQVNVFGTTSNRHFQVWIGLNGAQDITFAYDPAALPATRPASRSWSAPRTRRRRRRPVPAGVLPTEDLRVTSTDPTPGATVSYTVRVRGRAPAWAS